MSQYGTIYTMSWLTAQEDMTVTVNIYDTENLIDDSASPTVYDLIPTGNPCTIAVINNDRKKCGIKGKQAKLEFYSVPDVNAYTFAESNDQRWLVEIKTDADEMVLTGFIVLTDITRPFMPDKQIITLTVSDGLGLLKEKPLVTDGGSNPTGKLRIADFLRYALRQTGLNLEMAVVNNVRPYYDGTFLDSTNHLYSVIGVDAKTFEKAIGESEDCYTVLEKIIDKDCFLFQYRNRWWIVRPDDFDGNPMYITYFNLSATQYAYETLDNTRLLGVGNDNFFINAAQLVEYERPYKFAKHTYKYEQPLEIPCNVNFERGAVISGVPPADTTYQVDCWTLKRGYPTDPQGTTITPYIKRTFAPNEQENSRVLVMPNASTITYKEYLESEGIEVLAKDKINVSFDWRLQTSTGFNVQSLRYCSVVLHGSDGSWWMLGGDGLDGTDPSFAPGISYPVWYNTSGFTVNTAASEIAYDFGTFDELNFQSFTWESPAIPVDGTIYIWLNQFKQVSSSNSNRVIEYQNLSVEYISYTNGSYRKYNGQYSKVSRDNYSANIDENVSISDSSNPNIKGGLRVYDSGNWYLHDEYFNATPHSNGSPPDTTYVHPFEYIRVYSTFNQYRKGIRFFTGDVYGLGLNWPDLLHKWKITDTDYDSNARRFMILSFEQNWKTCRWSATFAETWHESGKVYSDDFTFKYES